MNRKLFSVAAVAALTALAALPSRADTFAVDPGHSEVSFQIRHLVSQVRGRFNDFSGTVQLDAKNLAASSVDFHIKVTSIDTNVADRDKHLRSADFFDVAKFPEITFTSESIAAAGKDKYNVTGSLTMHGVTKKVTLPVTLGGQVKDPWGNTRAGFEGKGEISRKEWGLEWNAALETGGVLVSDKVKITLDVSAVKRAQA
jgi:polyisoprenoid-binding protein YceI